MLTLKSLIMKGRSTNSCFGKNWPEKKGISQDLKPIIGSFQVNPALAEAEIGRV